MSDTRVRTLERRWRETGAADDQSMWLRERERAGELESWRIDVGCSLGDKACLLTRGLPPNHKESLVDVFDLLVSRTGPETILFWLVHAMGTWERLFPQEVSPDLGTVVRWMRSLFDSDKAAVDIWNEIIKAGANHRTASTTSIGLHILVELMRACATYGASPYQGTNPVAWASWVESAVREPQTVPIGGLALHVRRDLRTHCLPKLLGSV